MTKKCLRCGYEPNKLSHLKDHLKRKKKCEPSNMDIDTEDCLDLLNQKDDGKVIDILFIQLKKKDDKLKKLQEQVNKLSTNQSGNDNRNVECRDNNTIDQSVNIHISVNSFEKTDYSVLKDKIHTCIKNGKVDEAKLIKLLHFNKDAPQNHNIKIENKRENRIKVYNGKKFEESDYIGKEGIFQFSQDTLKKTGDQEFFENDDKAFDAIEKTKDENYTLNRNEKSKNVGKISTVIYNGTN
jgi:hypothetical protein